MMAFMKDWRSDNSALENYLKCRLRRFLRLIYKQILLYQTDEQYLSHKDELAVICPVIGHRSCHEGLLLLVHVHVDEAGLTVVKDL